MHKALDQCKIETVPGIDQISSNKLKIGDEVTVNWLKVIADQIWESEVIPKDWKCQIVIPIHKNGSKSLCQNYRGIALLCVASKVFGRAVLNKLQDMVESQLGENQCGFRPNRGCSDQIFSAKILMQRAKEFNKAIYFCFVDFQRAYDTVNIEALWEILSKTFSIPEKLIRIIKALYSDSTGLIRSEGLPISIGVKQGDVLAPILFNLYLDAVLKVALKNQLNKGIDIDYSYNAPLMNNSRHKLEKSTCVQNLAYADDILIKSSNIESLQCLVEVMNNIFAKFALKINFKKTKFMCILPDNTDNNIRNNIDKNHNINNKNIKINSCRNDEKTHATTSKTTPPTTETLQPTTKTTPTTITTTTTSKKTTRTTIAT